MTKKSKFWYLVSYGLNKRIKTKAFLVANIIIAVIIILLANITNIIAAVGGDFNEEKYYLVYDETNVTYPVLESLIESDSLINITLATGPFDSENLNFVDYDGTIRIYTDEVIESSLYIENISLMNETTIKMLLSSAKQTVWLNGLTPELQSEFASFPNLDTTVENISEETTDSENTIASVLATFIMLPLFIMLVMLMQFIGMDILEEKSSKSIEYIISNVEPLKHFGSKIVSSVLFLFIQTAIFIIAGVVGGLISSLFGNGIMETINSSDIPATELDSIRELILRLPMIIIVLVLFIVAGFTFYLVMIAVFSSMATNLEDYQQFITPVMLVVVASFYMALFGSLFSGSLILKIVGYIPIFSPMITPLLFISGEYSLLETFISLAILIVFDILIIYFGAPLYKVSILDYSQDKFFKKVIGLIKKAKYAQ